VEPFWQSCIDTVENIDPQYDRYSVCAIGTPGIGKKYPTPLLLRMLRLKQPPSTVVYICHSPKLLGYYEFVPTSEGGTDFTVNVYLEEFKRLPKIASLDQLIMWWIRVRPRRAATPELALSLTSSSSRRPTKDTGAEENSKGSVGR